VRRTHTPRRSTSGNELLLGPAAAVIVPTPAVLERVTLPPEAVAAAS
jgi:hypothetical protein